MGTPRSSDGAASPPACREKARGRLEDQVALAGQPGEGSSSTPGRRPGPSRRLNPRWDLQLMGYHSGWLDVPTDWLSKLLETR